MVPKDSSRVSQPLPDARRPNGTALALLGVMLLFWAALLGAELRELRAWQTYYRQALPVVTAAAASASEGAAALESSTTELVVVGQALRSFAWAQIAAGLGAAAAFVNLLAKRNGAWLLVTALALASILTSSHLFSVARAELAHRVLTEP